MATRTTPSAAALLQELIRFDTTNPPGDEGACLEHLRRLFADRGVEGTILADSTVGTSTVAVAQELVTAVETTNDSATTTFSNDNLVMTHTAVNGATESGGATQTLSPHLGPLARV